MRLAVLTDIHGNLAALEAVLEDISTQNVDHIVIAGDTVNILPDSSACWDRVTELENCTVLRGNHERYLFDYDTSKADPAWSSERFSALGWTLKQFTQADLDAMRSLPLTYRLPDLLICHATPQSDQVNIVAKTPLTEIADLFAQTSEAIIVRGHNHKWLERRWSSQTLISMASTGLPLDGDTRAQYLLLEQRPDGWCWRKQSVPYDLEKTLKRFDTSGYTEAGGSMVSLFREEVRTARGHLMPFLWRYLEPVEAGELGLREAVVKFLEEAGSK